MVERLTGGGIQPQQPGFRLHRDHLQPEQVAGIAQKAPAQRTDAAGAAGDEAADAGAAVGAGQQPQGPAAGGQLLIHHRHQGAGLHLDHSGSGVEIAQAVQTGEVQHHAAGQGHALAVVAGAGPAQGEGHAGPGTGAGHQPHLLHAGGPHRQLGPLAPEQGHQQRGVVEVVAREPLQLGRLGRGDQPQLDVLLAQFGGQLIDRGLA